MTIHVTSATPADRACALELLAAQLAEHAIALDAARREGFRAHQRARWVKALPVIHDPV